MAWRGMIGTGSLRALAQYLYFRRARPASVETWHPWSMVREPAAIADRLLICPNWVSQAYADVTSERSPGTNSGMPGLPYGTPVAQGGRGSTKVLDEGERRWQPMRS
jgi:hypothetical protein